MGRGNVKLCVEGRIQIITGVYYIPNLMNNLLSIGQLQQKKLKIIFDDDKCRVYHKEKGLLMTSYMANNRMFPIKAKLVITEAACIQTSNVDSTEMWHKRYGHLSYGGLKLLNQKAMVKGLPELKEMDKVCPECAVGKQHRDAISKQSTWRATRRLELIHSDICGPSTPTSNSNRRYFITFIDDFSRKTWVFFLCEKAEAFETFKRFRLMVEKESNCVISCLRTDRGGEFNSNDFNEFCTMNGIRRQLTAAYTPQQNGVAERKNRTIMDMVRTMLCEAKIHKSFWPEAVRWTVYLLNRCPTVAVKDLTPEEAWSSIKPSVRHLKVFGCIAYVHIADANRKKLDDKSSKCVFLGVSEESKAYRLYNPSTKKIVISRDVIFAEDEVWNWNNTEKTTPIACETEENEAAKTPAEQPIEAADASQDLNDHCETETESSQEQSMEESPEVEKRRRERRPPKWTGDYVMIADLQNEKNLLKGESDLFRSEFVQNSASSVAIDPTTFEEAVKHKKW
uniref:Retrovirus-related Pol polyprotein from transposon TNT 1-94 n=1 Tax=Cajanus cajan TaxID=3821 RepID=A0A151QYN6_CAJCA|nr:Retrovirus-related Pol polyprotein from transposon TNT 1-94 [Cajanus cajan]